MNEALKLLREMRAKRIFYLISKLRETDPERADMYLMRFYETEVQVKKEELLTNLNPN